MKQQTTTSADKPSADKSPVEVYFYLSSLIGYVRVVLVTYSLYIALEDYKTSIVCYTIAFICDFFDGYVERWLDQRSNYHAILDVVTDRCSTGGLLMILSHMYPSYLLVFMYLLNLDFASHWYHMYSCKGNHKRIGKDCNVLLRTYYGVYPFFGFCCIGTELFYISLYLLYFDPLFKIPGTEYPLEKLCFNVCLPACVLKNMVNMVKLASAASLVAQDDVNSKKEA
ncbi:hypothetical protein Poli38472_000254 [Pythium oligandrum]|uniref:CDP-diacylglycerol--inositol 3-phosphatidyltransferase n=1 Tax=Pythium oligandrum TaxID=41045 RepID=A0A8K1FHX7_PYTOL|nr:hypothetical protein Poli38472_000254 [Pythium oligandrum]|eukprot:TMW60212.1 hypothetical protein Poli38472_000254 [Pythium oligandrum]